MTTSLILYRSNKWKDHGAKSELLSCNCTDHQLLSTVIPSTRNGINSNHQDVVTNYPETHQLEIVTSRLVEATRHAVGWATWGSSLRANLQHL